ncbi:uncharacterized protein [Triticum aestivum]|uniref:uncharacterized protein isoform X1 n=1 Tax=Triticum aestivum TaxID=4565 RepID=UPI001D00C518|nr:uncharacterized protein LOC123113484 isoform X1 [Triticum aestivum]
MDIMEKVLEVKGEDAAKMALQEGLPADYIELLLNLWNFRMWGYHQEPARWQRLNSQRGLKTEGSSSCLFIRAREIDTYRRRCSRVRGRRLRLCSQRQWTKTWSYITHTE